MSLNRQKEKNKLFMKQKKLKKQEAESRGFLTIKKTTCSPKAKTQEKANQDLPLPKKRSGRFRNIQEIMEQEFKE